MNKQINQNVNAIDAIQSFEERRSAIEADLVVTACGKHGWAVLSLSGGSRGMEEAPMVIYANLRSFESAEVARHEVINQRLQDGCFYSSGETAEYNFDTKGKMLALLKSSDDESDRIDLVCKLYEASDRIPF